MKTQSLLTLSFALLTAAFVGAQGVAPSVSGSSTGTPAVPTYLFYYATALEETSGTIYPVISYETASAVEASAYLPVKERLSYTSSATLAEHEILRFLVVSTSAPLDTVSATDWDGNSQSAPKIPVTIQADGEPIALDWVTEAGITLETSWVTVDTDANEFVTINADGTWSNSAAAGTGLSNASISVSQTLDSSMTHYLFLVAYDTRDAEGTCAGVVDENLTVNAYGIAYVDTFTVGGSSPIGIKQYGYLISNSVTTATVGSLNPIRAVYTAEATVMKAPTEAQITFADGALKYADGSSISATEFVDIYWVRVAKDATVTLTVNALGVVSSEEETAVAALCTAPSATVENWRLPTPSYDETMVDALYVVAYDTRVIGGVAGNALPQKYAYAKLCDIPWVALPEEDAPEVLTATFNGPLTIEAAVIKVTFAEVKAAAEAIMGREVTEADFVPTFTAAAGDTLSIIPSVAVQGGFLYALETKATLADAWQDANAWLTSVTLPETATNAEKEALEALKAQDYTRIPADGATPLTLPKIAGESSRFYRLVCPAIDSESPTP